LVCYGSLPHHATLPTPNLWHLEVIWFQASVSLATTTLATAAAAKTSIIFYHTLDDKHKKQNDKIKSCGSQNINKKSNNNLFTMEWSSTFAACGCL